MEFTISREKLHGVLQTVQALADRADLMPILSHALIEAREEGLKVSATNLQVGMEHLVKDASIVSLGAAALPSRKLFQVVRELPEEILKFRSEEGSVRIECRGASVKLKSLDPEQFPGFPTIPSDCLSEVPSQIVAEMIDKVIYAVAAEHVQPNLTGVHVERLDESGKVRFVGTDGHRLSLVDREMELDVPKDPSPIVPRRGMLELRRLLSQSDQAEIGFFEAHMGARIGDSMVYVRLLDAMFPAYKDVIPKFGSNRARAKKEDLLGAVRRASLLSTQAYAPSVLLEMRKGGLKVSCNNPELGEFMEIIEIDYSGQPTDILFNPRYLVDALSVVSAETAVIEFTDNSSPVVLRDPSDEDFLAVIMPMRL